MQVTEIQICILSFLTVLRYSASALFDYRSLLLGFCHSQSTFCISKVILWMSKIFCSRSGGTTPRSLQPHTLNPHHHGDDRAIPSSPSIFPFSCHAIFTKFPDLVHSISPGNCSSMAGNSGQRWREAAP